MLTQPLKYSNANISATFKTADDSYLIIAMYNIRTVTHRLLWRIGIHSKLHDRTVLAGLGME